MAILKNLIVNGVTRVIGDLTASKIIKQGGVSSQFLKADGSIDSTSYYHSGNKPSLSDLGAAAASHTHSYLPLSGGTVFGTLTLSNSSVTDGDDTTELFRVYSGTGYKNGLSIFSINNKTYINAKPYGYGTANALYLRTYNSDVVDALELAANGDAKFVGSVTASSFIGNVTQLYTSTIGISDDSHASALQNYFNNYKSSISRNCTLSFHSYVYGGESQYMGYFINGYNDTPYGGFFVANYDSCYYVGISHGYYNEQTIITSKNIGSQSVKYASSSGDADTASKWSTARKITLTGSVTGEISVDGSSDVTLDTTTNHTHSYLPLSGGIISNTNTQAPLIISAPGMGDYCGIQYNNNSYRPLGILGFAGINIPAFKSTDASDTSWKILYHSSNLTASVIGNLGTLSNNISGNAATANNADTLDNLHAYAFARSKYGACSNSDDSMTTCTDLTTWISRLGSTGVISGTSSISTGSWWWARSVDFQVNGWNIRTSGAMVIHSSNGDSSDKNYKHLLVLDAYGDLYGITSNLDLEKYTKFVKTSDLPTKVSQLTNDAGYKTTDTTYSTATSDTLGLVKIGYTANGRNYPVQLSDGKMYVNVPWTDTDTNTWRPITDSYSGTDSNTSLSQKGGKAIYDALKNGYATSAGSSTYSNTLEVQDVRGSDIIPSKFDSHRITGWFNESTGLLSGDWCSGITVKGWHDGYSSWQLAGYSSTSFGKHGLFFREAANDSGWRDWIQVITSDNISSQTVAIANLARTLSQDNTINLYVHNNNELNFGGTNASTTIYFGYRAADSRAIPTSFVFGGSSGSATLTANGFIKKDSSDSYVLLGGGGHKVLSDFVQISGDQSISGTKTFSGTIKANRAESTTGFFQTSDIRYKNIIEYYYSLSNKIAQLPIIKYKWTDRDDDSIRIGSSAQSVMNIIPELVSYDNNTDFYSLDYATLGAVAGISACKEVEILKQKIKELEQEIIILKSKYNG